MSQEQGGRFSGNTASDSSRQLFGNHAAGSAGFGGQVFEQNAVTKDSDQIFGSSWVPEGQKPERPGSEKSDKKQAGK
jgi:hypothetical protein